MTTNTAYAVQREVFWPQRETAIDVLSEAFADDPVTCWSFPDAEARAGLLARFHRHLMRHPAAEVHLAGRREGAAVWLPLTGDEPPEDEQGAAPLGERLRTLGSALARHHPAEPHLYLPCIGVARDRRGSGVGSALLRSRLTRADADGLAVYLEASSSRSRALYLRHGFVDLGEPVRVADSPPVWPMLRRSTGTEGENR